ncbi:acetylcholinesterase-like isoform X1 [Amphibalanus amphitrite]|uniref:acetylcholinesterase-like isoform X1 n=1 Tax=Amphibalanus amphitrite TaxID=1232801 RepID=UPI001C91DA65|nr:acetylcholinesterase-like isoform X1 [Amphibalanus amphitrite]
MALRRGAPLPMSLLALLTLAPLRSCAQQSIDEDGLVVRTNKGLVRGMTQTAATGRQVDVWLGIPFAKPPIGPLRFKHPQPMHLWHDVRDAKQQPNSCWQTVDDYFGDFEGSSMWNANTPMSEDCLYLNVVSPRPRPARPAAVMVWIFGGGFYSGTSTLDVYDAKILASQEGVVFVSFQYRVASLGYLYLDTPAAPGNAGMFDQLMALQWVQDNIAAFGGNPHNVTLFGESAGAASINMHLVSPLSRSLFSQAILQSGSATNPWAVVDKREAALRGLRLAEAVKCPDTNPVAALECLRRTDPKTLVYSEGFLTDFCDFAFVPVVDGSFLVETPRASLASGNFKKVNLLMGSNKDEGYFYLLYYLTDLFGLREDPQVTHEMFLDAVKQLHPRLTTPARSAIAFEYTPWANTESSAHMRDAIDEMAGDHQFTCGLMEVADVYARANSGVYMYFFSQRSSVSPWPRYMGVLHGDEILFVFGLPLNPAKHYTPEEAELSSKMMRYWANFAKTGNPNRGSSLKPSLDYWPLHSVHDRSYLTLSVNSSAVGVGPKIKRCAFWQKHLPNLQAATADISDTEAEWKLQFAHWKDEYIVNWRNEFDKYQAFMNRQNELFRAHRDRCQPGLYGPSYAPPMYPWLQT